MSWFLIAGKLVRLLEEWDDLSEDARYLYKRMLQEMVNDESTRCYWCMQAAAKGVQIGRYEQLTPEEWEEHYKNAPEKVFGNIAQFGLQCLKAFQGTQPGYAREEKWKEPVEYWTRQVKDWLRQIYDNGYRYGQTVETLTSLIMTDYSKDGNQEEPECEICPHWGPGPDKWSKYMCCQHGAFRPGYNNGARVTHPFEDEHLAPNWCPRRLKNSQCTCNRCPECTHND